MNIRPASAQDSYAIRKLISRYPEQLMQTKIPAIEDFFVVQDQDAVVACCALEIYSKRIAEIRSLAVDERYQKRGLATQLVEACIKKAKEEGVDEILAISSAKTFFEKCGFGTFQQEKYALLKKL